MNLRKIALKSAMILPETPFNSEQEIFITGIRSSGLNTIVIIGLMVSFLLFALAKWSRNDIFHFLKNISFNRKSTSVVLKDYTKTKRLSDFLLLINFWLLCVLGSILLLNNPTWKSVLPHFPEWLLYTWPVLAHLWQKVFLYFVSLLSGNQAVYTENNVNLLLFPQIAGIVLFPILLVWLLNSQLNSTFSFLYFIVLFSLFIYIILKGIINSLKQSIPYFYIILYICTLEILPLIFVASWIVG
jgi:hypothetical protein